MKKALLMAGILAALSSVSALADNHAPVEAAVVPASVPAPAVAQAPAQPMPAAAEPVPVAPPAGSDMTMRAMPMDNGYGMPQGMMPMDGYRPNNMPMMTAPQRGMMNPMMMRQMMMMRQQAMQQQARQAQQTPPGMVGAATDPAQAAAPAMGARSVEGNQMPCPMHKGKKGQMMRKGNNCKSMKQKKMAMKKRHMQAVEIRLANIEALMRELVELQKARQ